MTQASDPLKSPRAGRGPAQSTDPSPHPPEGAPASVASGALAPGAAALARATGGARTADHHVHPRREQYLIGRRRWLPPLPVEHLDLNLLERTFLQDPAIEHVRTLRPRHLLSALAHQGDAKPQLLVARMDDDRVQALRQHPALIVEVDQPLRLPSVPVAATTANSGLPLPCTPATSVVVTVRERNGAPVEGATVVLLASAPTEGITDSAGKVRLAIADQSPDAVTGLFVNPRADHWNLWIPNPALVPDQDNVVTLASLDTTFAGFPQQEVMGWGERAMNLDHVPAEMRGHRARVAIIDTGAATTHRDLAQQVAMGIDLVAGDEGETWKQDPVSHGTFGAGIIAGAVDGRGIRGFAPEAEVHICRVLPGGHVSDLIAALDHCIEQSIDVACLSLAIDERSELVEQKIAMARQAGVACIAAAGNTGGRVQYPASSPEVLAVGAIGRLGVFPAGTYHGRQLVDEAGGWTTPEGYFPARFSCHGPEIGVCGPGVAVLSSVPPDNVAVWDGTSAAAAHICGLATLVVAHHPDFRGLFAPRNGRRVERLFQILQNAAHPRALHPHHVGAGLPDTMRALGLVAMSSDAAVPLPWAGAPSNPALEHLLRQLGIHHPGNGAPTTSAAPAADAATQMRELRREMVLAGLLTPNA